MKTTIDEFPDIFNALDAMSGILVSLTESAKAAHVAYRSKVAARKELGKAVWLETAKNYSRRAVLAIAAESGSVICELDGLKLYVDRGQGAALCRRVLDRPLAPPDPNTVRVYFVKDGDFSFHDATIEEMVSP